MMQMLTIFSLVSFQICVREIDDIVYCMSHPYSLGMSSLLLTVLHNDNDNESMFIVKVVQKSKSNNQQCKYIYITKNIVKW